MMIRKIKEILNILSNNIEKYGVKIHKGTSYLKDGEPYTHYVVTFYKDEKWYCMVVRKETLCININTKTACNVGGTYEIAIPSNEILSITLILDTMILRGRDYIEKQISNLELL